MFGSRLFLKSIALLLLAFSISGLTSAHDSQRSLADVDEIMMPSTDEYAYGERRLSWNFWSSMMFDVLGSWCAGPDGYCRLVCGPPPTYCQYYEGPTDDGSKSNRGLGDTSNVDDDCDDDTFEPDYTRCEICKERPKPKPPSKPSSNKSSSSSSTTDDDCDDEVEADHTDDHPDDDCDDYVHTNQAKAATSGTQSTGMSMSNMMWMFAVAAAVVAMVVAGVIMRKRRNTDEDLFGSFNTRAAALLGGGAAAAGAGAAAVPKFLSAPSMRRTPSGIEVNQDQGVIQQSPSIYYEMEGADDESHLPDGIELSKNGSALV